MNKVRFARLSTYINDRYPNASTIYKAKMLLKLAEKEFDEDMEVQ